ncbi:unnamed protein product [Schistosoma mattheei]|uniref:Uncharacterized protein n=1 Tax=Schistosoma mattheei TaxID=31246 RepID=A0A183NZ83_9TREM|nr:unnamed protein product [Schistosoma mattheei]
MIENIIAYADPELYRHFVQYNITTEIYAWPLLQTGLSEVFNEDEWLCLWDSLICYSPSLLLAAVASYSICARGPLLMVQNTDTIENFRQINSQNNHHTNYPCHQGTSVFLNCTCLNFCALLQKSLFFVCQQAYYHSQSTLPISNIIERAHQLLTSIPSDIHPEKLLSSLIQTDTQNKNKENTCLPFQPLTSPYYPIITRYPKFIVNYHIQERERIREEEKEYLRQKYRQQQLLLDAEDHRRTLLAEEENKLREQRKRLNALIREVKLHELSLAEESRCHFRQLDIRRRQCELNKLEQELTRLTNCRIDEIDAATYAAELADLREKLHQRRAETLAIINEQLQSRDRNQPPNKECLFLTSSPDTNESITHDRYLERNVNEVHSHSPDYVKTSVDSDVAKSNLKRNSSYNKDLDVSYENKSIA